MMTIEYSEIADRFDNTNEVIELIKDNLEEVISLDKQRPFMRLAIACGDLELIKFLHSIGADVECKGVEYPLKTAAKHGKPDIMQWLLEYGLHPDGFGKTIDDEDGQAGEVLFSAILKGSAECVQLLLNYGASLDVRNQINDSDPLDYAVFYGNMFGSAGHRKIVKLLEQALDKGAESIEKLTPKDYFPEQIKHIANKLNGEPQLIHLTQMVHPIGVTLYFIKRQIGNHEQLILCTDGVSEHVLSNHGYGDQYQYMELMMFLPYEINVQRLHDLTQQDWVLLWSFRYADLFKSIGRHLGPEGMVTDSIEPIADSQMHAFLFSPEEELTLKDEKCIQYYSLWPLYTEELKWAENHSVSEFISKFKEVDDVESINLNREKLELK